MQKYSPVPDPNHTMRAEALAEAAQHNCIKHCSRCGDAEVVRLVRKGTDIPVPFCSAHGVEALVEKGADGWFVWGPVVPVPKSHELADAAEAEARKMEGEIWAGRLPPDPYRNEVESLRKTARQLRHHGVLWGVRV